MLDDVTTLIFDLDGTISDPSLGISRCFNFSLVAHGFNEVSADMVAAEIGPPLDEMFKKFQPKADRPIISSLVTKYRERYAEIGYAENELYPGIHEEVRALSERGVRLGICTSKRSDFAEKILTRFDLLAYFQFVDGGDVGIKKKEQLAGMIASGKIDRNAVMIGDREVDILAAWANNLRSVGVLWGFGDLDELKHASPDLIIHEVKELGQCVP